MSIAKLLIAPYSRDMRIRILRTANDALLREVRKNPDTDLTLDMAVWECVTFKRAMDAHQDERQVQP
ncbi:MAG: hypothetical protein EHM85_19760 [Desulfobacteraceae bacterium]|nr:MAG: hypothetical protein EHM85_19760 [Desulfobacteraceae bacterium]